MDLQWSLKELYPAFDSKEFIGDLEKCNDQINSIKEWTKSNLNSHSDVTTKIESYIYLIKDFTSLYTKLMAYTHLSFTVDTTDEEDSVLAELIAESWRNLLKSRYPERNFTVEILSPQATGSTVGVGFYEIRLPL